MANLDLLEDSKYTGLQNLCQKKLEFEKKGIIYQYWSFLIFAKHYLSNLHLVKLFVYLDATFQWIINQNHFCHFILFSTERSGGRDTMGLVSC